MGSNIWDDMIHHTTKPPRSLVIDDLEIVACDSFTAPSSVLTVTIVSWFVSACTKHRWRREGIG